MTTPRILMCPPDFYGIEYEINPWMSTERRADHAVAVEQWQRLVGVLQELGAKIERLAPQSGLPDMVFTANAGLVFQNRAILSRFRHVQRQGEEAHFERWFGQAGFEVLHSPAGFSFEGAGDALFCGDTLLAGYRLRSDASGVQQIGERLGVHLIPLELIDPYYYHLDTCFCPISAEAAIYFPAAFDDYGRRVLRELVPTLIEIDPIEARRFGCNAVVLGRTVVTNEGCPKLHAELNRLGYNAVETPLSEFVKAGGSAKCLTLRLDGEEAANWGRRP